jgi:cell division protein FtsB
MKTTFHPNAATNRQNAVTGLMDLPVDMKFVTHSLNFAALQRQFDDLRKIIEQRNAEIATLKARIDALERKE